MNLDRLSDDWWFGLCRTVEMRDEVDWTPLQYEDSTVYPIRSAELGRTYCCYHVVGSDLDFILKKSDENEAAIYSNLNHYNISSRLRVPRMYKRLKITDPSTGVGVIYIVLEHITVADGFGLTDCSDQVDGLLMYQEGQSVDAWASTGYELARICSAYWRVLPLEGILYDGMSYELLLSEIRSSSKIRTDIILNSAFEKVAARLNSLPRCLQNLDLLPINVMVKERNYRVNGETIVRPNAFIVDWKNARPAPYILDLARIVSHCYREIVINREVQLYSNKYCSDLCREAIINSFLNELRKRKPELSPADSEKDLLCGEFFEIARMYIQMPGNQPQNSYDRYYCHNIQRLAESVLSAF